jgi:VanZ family protein
MKHRIHHVFWFWLPPLGYMTAIFYVSSLPSPQIGGETPDYVLHALEYFLLALLLIRLFLSLPHPVLLNLAAFVPFFNKTTATFRAWHAACLLGALISILYGASDELHQYFVPGRHCSLSDVIADAFGAFLAYGIALLDYWLITRTSFRKAVLKNIDLLFFLYVSPEFSEKEPGDHC